MVSWEEIYRRNGIVQSREDSFVVRAIDTLKKFKVRKIYDYGAGTGRNSLFLARRGYEVIAYDPSSSGRKLLASLVNNGLRDKIKILNNPLCELNSVDCSIAINSIHHGNYNSVKKGICNIVFPVRPKGLIMFKCLSEEDPCAESGSELENKTRINIPNWADGSLPHHFFSKDELSELFSGLKILSVTKVVEPVEFFPDMTHHYLELLAQKN